MDVIGFESLGLPAPPEQPTVILTTPTRPGQDGGLVGATEPSEWVSRPRVNDVADEVDQAADDAQREHDA
jgi:hypothetical protein